MKENDLLKDMETDLDQLIENAKAMKNACFAVSIIEINAFQKTQESLLAHLLSTEMLLKKKKQEGKMTVALEREEKAQKKLRQFQLLNKKFIQSIVSQKQIVHFTKPKISLRKRRLSSFSLKSE